MSVDSTESVNPPATLGDLRRATAHLADATPLVIATGESDLLDAYERLAQAVSVELYDAGLAVVRVSDIPTEGRAA